MTTTITAPPLPGERGTCTRCGGSYQLTKRGLIRRHVGADRRDCPGGGHIPQEDQR